MGRLVLASVLLSTVIFASEYTSTSSMTASSKTEACTLALNSAREDALGQAGTLVINEYSSTTTVNDKKYNHIKQKELKTLSLGVVKLVSKKEDIFVTPDYQFNCTVKATFSIDEDAMKKAIDKYLANGKKEQNKNSIYIQAIGYSEEGQSAYRAIKAATIDAKRNLLDEIKGSELMSIIEANDGKLVSDQVINSAKGKIRYIKILSKKYNSTSKSATVTVGMTKEALEKNIKMWKED